MTLRDKAAKKLKELKAEALDKENRRRIKEEVRRRFTEGREKLRQIEKKLADPETRRKAEEELKKVRARYAKMKVEFQKREQQARDYTQKHPDKALAVAAAAGALVGALWMAVRRRK